MKNKQRKALLVGSLPFENEEIAMNKALDMLGPDLHSLPDGEIGEKSAEYPLGNRAAWIQSIVDLCEKDTENWTLVKQAVRSNQSGFPIGYDKEPRLKPKRSPSTMHQYLDFRWLEYFKSSYPTFKKLKKEKGLDHLKFQVGLPTGIGITFPMMNPINALRYAKAFNKRMAYEANEILKIADPDDLIFQIEVPGELAMAYKLPKFLVSLSLRTIFGLLQGINPQAPFGVHICFGDLNNEALTKVKTLDKMVHFSNTLVKKWPKSHQLAYVHYPLAEAVTPPPTHQNYYQTLEKVILPENTRFVAGFVHDKLSNVEHEQILTMIESIRGHQVDIACSCGLGRRKAEVAQELMQITHELINH
ncbi:MAG TPA: hypothetical protein DCS93_21995 [Microscillaceae bacterium]|nr:hypothetical protein [Microscillaceae bacterium]